MTLFMSLQTDFPPPPPPSSGCFPPSASVILDSGKSVKMDELQIGDRVKTGTRFPLLFLLLFL